MLTIADLENDPYHRMLVMGPPKCGKSSACVATAPGPVAIILCEADSALKGPVRHSPGKDHFIFCRVKDWDSMQRALVEVKEAVKTQGVKTIVVDPLSDFATALEEQCLRATWNDKNEPDGRRAYPEYNNRLRHVFDQLFRLKAHLIVITHYIETGGSLIGDQLDKTGVGIVPLLAGKARATVAAKFNDVIWMEIRKVDGKPQRVFITGPEGAWGPGCRSLDGTHVLPADVTKLFKRFDEGVKAEAGSAVKPAQAKPSAPPQKATTKTHNGTPNPVRR